MDNCLQCGQPVESEGFRPKKFCSDSCRYDFHNKKKKKWTLKKLAKYYQETGEYLPEAEALEEIYIMSIAEEIEELSKKEIAGEIYYLNIDMVIKSKIAYWQLTNGFARPLDMT